MVEKGTQTRSCMSRCDPDGQAYWTNQKRKNYLVTNMQLDFSTTNNLREHPLFSDYFADLKSNDRWRMLSLNGDLYDLGEWVYDTLEELLGTATWKELGFLCRFDEDGILEQAFPPKVFADNNSLVLKFGDAALELIPVFTETNGRKIPVIVNDSLQLKINTSKATAFLSESKQEERINVTLTVSMQSQRDGSRLRLTVPVAIAKNATKVSIEDYLGYGAGEIGVHPVPSGSTPTEGAFLISRGTHKEPKYPVLASPEGGESVDAPIVEVEENNNSEHGGFFVKVKDGSGLCWTVFSNQSLKKQLLANAYLEKDEAEKLGLNGETILGSKIAVPKWQLINCQPMQYFIRVKPERQFTTGKYTADVLIVKGEPNSKFILTPVKVATRIAGSSDQPQLKSATIGAIEAEIVH